MAGYEMLFLLQFFCHSPDRRETTWYILCVRHISSIILSTFSSIHLCILYLL